MAKMVQGGDRLRKWLAVAKRGGVRGIGVGFVKTARYPKHYGGRGGKRRKPRKNPPYVAQVAAWNEWGTRTAPARPFIRPSIPLIRRSMRQIMFDYVDPRHPVITKTVADLIGMSCQSILRQKIIDVKTPPNAPSTIRRKGSSNPLVDTGFLGRSVSWEVNE